MTYASLLINTCSVIHRTLDKWGAVISEVTIPNVKCRIEYKTRLIRNMKGEQVISYAHVFFLTSANIDHNDRLYFDGREWSILRFERQQDSVNVHHKEVFV
jgi:hypothetical protein